MVNQKEIIEDIINEWDPLDLFPTAPADEYSYEIDRITNVAAIDNDINDVAEQIYQIFREAFGNMFDRSIFECKNIANKILSRIL